LRASIFDLAASSATVPPVQAISPSSPRTGRTESVCDSPEPVYEAASRYALKYVFGRKLEASR
jgi:hypothetical protein